MIKNYLLVAIRNFRKGKVFSFINIMGLAVGMTCCFLIMLFVRDELSYDHFQNKLDQLYRITYTPKFAGLDKGLPVLSIAAALCGHPKSAAANGFHTHAGTEWPDSSIPPSPDGPN